MSYLEELKSSLHARIEAQTSTEVLEQVQQYLAQPAATISPELEARLAEGIDDLENGRYVSFEEFVAQGKLEAKERARRHKA